MQSFLVVGVNYDRCSPAIYCVKWTSVPFFNFIYLNVKDMPRLLSKIIYEVSVFAAE